MVAFDPLSLVGQALRSIHYDLLAWEPMPSEASAVDEVSMGVLLGVEEFQVMLRWELRPPVERLAAFDGRRLAPAPLARRFDVSARWAAFIGARISDVSWSEQLTEGGLQPWAVTLAFAEAGELVVALGEVVDGHLSYIPDAMVVTARREVASAYRPPASRTPAWTSTLAGT